MNVDLNTGPCLPVSMTSHAVERQSGHAYPELVVLDTWFSVERRSIFSWGFKKIIWDQRCIWTPTSLLTQTWILLSLSLFSSVESWRQSIRTSWPIWEEEAAGVRRQLVLSEPALQMGYAWCPNLGLPGSNDWLKSLSLSSEFLLLLRVSEGRNQSRSSVH